MTASKLDLAQFEGHTPGPWKIGETMPAGNRYIETSAGYVVAKISGLLAYKKAQPINAALIAAAPALLAECRRQREEIARLREALEEAANDLRRHEAYQSEAEARAALKGPQ